MPNPVDREILRKMKGFKKAPPTPSKPQTDWQAVLLTLAPKKPVGVAWLSGVLLIFALLSRGWGVVI